MENNKLTYTPSSNGVCAGPLGTQPNLKFTPALSVIEGQRSKEHFKQYSLTWWEDSSIFKYNAMLCSAFYGMQDKLGGWTYRERYRIPKDFLLIADSGGFEQKNSDIRLLASDVIKWQENNADIGFTLDVPPVDANLQFTTDNDYFKKCADATINNSKTALSYRKKMTLYYVMQGHTTDQLEYWSNNMLSQFDGCALSHKSKFLVWLAVQAMFVKEKGIKNIHVLTGTGKLSLPIIVYLRKHFKQVTFDSSSYGTGARLRSYNADHGYHLLFGDSYNNKVQTLPCDCPVCQIVSIKDFQVKDSVAGALISLHNLYTYIRHINFLNSIVDDDEIFNHYISHHTSQRTQEAINFIKKCEDIGFEKAYKDFLPDKSCQNKKLLEMF